MIKPENFFNLLKKNKINDFYGVPDSNLKHLIRLLDNKKEIKHHICTNEGSAISMAIGHYLSSKKLSAVYMQNSGLSNALNPLLSIAHSDVYSIPLLLIIGWRGSPGSKDEPQHIVKGKITPAILKLCDVKTLIIKKKSDLKKISALIKFSKLKEKSVAILIQNNSFEKIANATISSNVSNRYKIKRRDVIWELCSQIKKKTFVVSNTGFASRELHEILQETGNKYIVPFYMIGGMGHTSMVALSNAINRRKFDTICLDGDGSLIMHLGSSIKIGSVRINNYKHILFNNFQHESVGGQSTNVENISFSKFAKIVGYKLSMSCNIKKDLKKKISLLLKAKSTTFLEVKGSANNYKKLSRPRDFFKIKKNFMNKC